MDLESARDKLKAHGQEQLLRFSGDLTADQLGILVSDIEEIDFSEVEEFWKQEKRSTAVDLTSQPIRMEPVPPEACGSVLRDKGKLKHWEQIGKQMLFTCFCL